MATAPARLNPAPSSWRAGVAAPKAKTLPFVATT